LRNIVRITNPKATAAYRHRVHSTLVQEQWLRYQIILFMAFACGGAAVRFGVPNFAVS
jgi:hypothetical protein